MIPDVVADVGNTRIKWGLCQPDEIAVTYSLPPDPAAWEEKRSAMLPRRFRWVVASVQPARSERLIEWIRGRGDEAVLLRHEHLPLKVNVEEPAKVGIDRLLNAVAAASALDEGERAVLVDAGSAVTVDYLDEEHVFQGGAILPGLDLMAEALHSYTALLPRVEVREPLPSLPGKATVPAIQLGILHAVTGAIWSITKRYRALALTTPFRLFMTGGQARLLADGLEWDAGNVWPEMTLTGILIAARGLS